MDFDNIQFDAMIHEGDIDTLVDRIDHKNRGKGSFEIWVNDTPTGYTADSFEEAEELREIYFDGRGAILHS